MRSRHYEAPAEPGSHQPTGHRPRSETASRRSSVFRTVGPRHGQSIALGRRHYIASKG